MERNARKSGSALPQNRRRFPGLLRRKIIMPTRIKIFWLDGGMIRQASVAVDDLPRLSGVQTFWRELPEDETGKILEAKIGAKMTESAKTGLKTA